ncbi:conserved hypothetical protein (plasmid) [Borreliella burgdorferi WI91-23]|nr:conserved hypothetical protein [Borreliella burgdorferi 64b]ACN55292.1 conserved hypothetical protein [Borreliella burgdorferi WI91-23]
MHKLLFLYFVDNYKNIVIESLLITRTCNRDLKLKNLAFNVKFQNLDLKMKKTLFGASFRH